MPIGIGEDHEELRRTVRRWLEARCPPEVPRALLDAPTETMPPFWDELAGQGWLGIHVAEEHGGQGFGMLEAAVVVEEMARAVMPGPALPTMLAAAVLAAGADDAQRKVLLAPLADGTLPTAVALPGVGALVGRRDGDGSLEVRGELGPVLGATLAHRLLAPVELDGGDPDGGDPDGDNAVWCVIDLEGDGVTRAPLASLDPTRRVGSVTVSGAVVVPERQLPSVTSVMVRDLALVLGAAECAGGARWCLDVGTAYAIERRQFGRPIGQFQAIKHRLADMLVAVEQVTALAWDAAQAADAGDADQARLSAVLAGAFALDAYVACAEACIQILGGMGFTWEHDAHLHLRRALTVRQLLGPSSTLRTEATRAALHGSRRRLEIELPEEAERIRDEVRAVIAEVAAAPDAEERRRRLVDTGLLTPHWPAPWGRGAGPVEQLVIDEELAAAHVHRPHLAVGAWALPTIIAHGTAQQQERWVGPTMRGELVWCQLFSEPGAGSDLAALSMRATRHDGGWVLNGQKVWTSIAQQRRLGDLSGAERPRGAQARGHHVLHRRHAHRGHRGPTPARDHRGGDVQRGVLHRRVRARRLRGGSGERGVAPGPHHARQRARVDGGRCHVGIRDRGDPQGHQGLTARPEGPRTRWPSTASARCWPRRSPLLCSEPGPRSGRCRAWSPDPRRACASSSAPSTSSVCRNSGSCSSGPGGRPPRTTRAGGARDFSPPAV